MALPAYKPPTRKPKPSTRADLAEDRATVRKAGPSRPVAKPPTTRPKGRVAVAAHTRGLPTGPAKRPVGKPTATVKKPIKPPVKAVAKPVKKAAPFTGSPRDLRTLRRLGA